MSDSHQMASSPPGLPGGPLAHSLFIAALIFAAVAPTLAWMQFDAGMEKVCVATALETARDGNWLIPELNDEPRFKKPPFAHWMGALGILSSDDIHWGARWPTLVAGCVFIVATYWLARITVGEQIAPAAALICGTNYLFFRYVRQASYDIPLAMWVGLGNVFLSLAFFRGRYWAGFCGAGVALGLALLTKGPVALIQSVLPFGLFLLAERRHLDDANHATSDATRSKKPAVAAPALVGLILLMLFGVGWYLYVASIYAGRWDFWMGQVTLRTERHDEPWDPWYTYLEMVPMMAPWAVWAVVGIVAFAVSRTMRNRGVRLCLWLLVVPIVIMSFFWVKRNRYLVPMLTPASILAAWGVHAHLPGWIARKAADKVLAAIHWIGLGIAAAGLPLAGAIGRAPFTTIDGGSWWSWPVASVLSLAALAAVLGLAMAYRRRPGALVGGTAILLLATQLIYYYGYRRSPESQSEGKPLSDAIVARYPNALIYNAHPDPRDAPLEISIYANRVVRRLRHIESLKPSDRPQVILVPTRSPPLAAPAGFEYIDRVQIGKTWWYAFVMPAVSASG